MITIGQLKDIIKDMPDDSVVLQEDCFSEYSYNVALVNKMFARIDHVTNDGTPYYMCFPEDDYEDMKEESETDEFKQVLLFTL